MIGIIIPRLAPVWSYQQIVLATILGSLSLLLSITLILSSPTPQFWSDVICSASEIVAANEVNNNNFNVRPKPLNSEVISRVRDFFGEVHLQHVVRIISSNKILLLFMYNLWFPHFNWILVLVNFRKSRSNFSNWETC